MGWTIGRGRYGAEALTREEIQRLQASHETAAAEPVNKNETVGLRV